MFFGSWAELPLFGPAPWEAVIRGAAVGESPWHLTPPLPRSQRSRKKPRALPGSPACSSGLAPRTSILFPFYLGQVELDQITDPRSYQRQNYQNFSHSRAPFMAFTASPSHLKTYLLSISNSWKSFKCLNQIGLLLAENIPLASHFGVKSRAFTTAYEAHIISPLDISDLISATHSLHSCHTDPFVFLTHSKAADAWTCMEHLTPWNHLSERAFLTILHKTAALVALPNTF